MQLRRLKDEFEGSIYSYLKPKLDNPITVMEAVLEVIWTAVRPLLRTLQLLCDLIAVVIKQAKVGNKLILKIPVRLSSLLKMCTQLLAFSKREKRLHCLADL